MFENRKLTDRVFYVPGVKEDSWNKVPAALLSALDCTAGPVHFMHSLQSVVACQSLNQRLSSRIKRHR